MLKIGRRHRLRLDPRQLLQLEGDLVGCGVVDSACEDHRARRRAANPCAASAAAASPASALARKLGIAARRASAPFCWLRSRPRGRRARRARSCRSSSPRCSARAPWSGITSCAARASGARRVVHDRDRERPARRAAARVSTTSGSAPTGRSRSRARRALWLGFGRASRGRGRRARWIVGIGSRARIVRSAPRCPSCRARRSARTRGAAARSHDPARRSAPFALEEPRHRRRLLEDLAAQQRRVGGRARFHRAGIVRCAP